jgi:hypothetical protein
MLKSVTLESLIKERLHLRRSRTGWDVGKCQVCNDYKDRAGFKFENNYVVYNCWNCGTTSRYEEGSGHISKNMRRILNAYGFDDTEISDVVNSTFFKPIQKAEVITLSSISKINTNTPTVKLPPKSYRIGSDEFTDYQEKLVSYLINRKIDLIKYPFYFSMETRFINRVIIPFYRNGHLIYWQARSIDESEKKRYDNSPVSRNAVIFNFDQLYTYSPGPLFVTEGVFDAMIVNGVAILGSKLNDAKIELFSKTNRRLVFVIDKDKNGKQLAEDVLSRGWEIAFAPDGASDINNAAQRFGKIWTIQQLFKSIPKTTSEAQLAININCK